MYLPDTDYWITCKINAQYHSACITTVWFDERRHPHNVMEYNDGKKRKMKTSNNGR
jgi:hypothetical protein